MDSAAQQLVADARKVLHNIEQSPNADATAYTFGKVGGDLLGFLWPVGGRHCKQA